MTPERWRQVKEVVEAAWERNPSERGEFLDRACADDRELRVEVDGILSSDEHASGFLTAPAMDLVQDPAIDTAALETSATGTSVTETGVIDTSGEYWTSRRLGPYQILREIGHGGMGTVYLAERADGQYRKQVAIKLVSPHFCTEEILRRFRNERQVEAFLDHPNIARLLDGGATENGLPYLVMEYVDGVRIDAWCDSRKLPVRDRLKLFRQLCAAVQAAHEKEIIHRDIKPGNILVTAEGTPKLLDFGIAKILNRELSDSAETTIGTGPMTLAYASPEQVRGERVGPASDVYALGVVLYQLLTGQLPYAAQRGDSQSLAQAICEQEPIQPSVAIQRIQIQRSLEEAQQAGAERQAASDARSESPTGLRRRLAGDLDNIVLKALRKEPDRRYRSVEEFSEDIGRFLEDLPVQARKERWWYRLGKFLKRNRVAATAALSTAALALAAFTAWQVFGRKPYEFAPDPSSIAVLPFIDMSAGEGQDYFDAGFTNELRNAMAAIPALRVASNELSNQVRGEDVRVAARKLNVAAILKGTVLKHGASEKITARLFKADGRQQWSGTFERETSGITVVEREITKAVTAELSTGKSTNAEAHTAYLQGHYFLSNASKENLPKAIGYFEQAIRLDPGYAPAWVEKAGALTTQAEAGLIPPEEGYTKARQSLERALALDPNFGEAYSQLALIQMYYDHDWTGAYTSLERARVLQPGEAAVMLSAAELARKLGRMDEAIGLFRQAIKIDPLRLNAYRNLGKTLYYSGRLQEATEAIDKALDFHDMPYAHGLLSEIYLALSRPRDALAEAAKEGIELFRLRSLALAYHALNDKGNSDASLNALIAKYPKDGPFQIAEVYAFRGEADRAFEWLERANTEHDGELAEMKVDPLLNNLRRDPRYTEFLRRMRLPVK